MTRALAQTRELARLSFRWWMRAALRTRGGKTKRFSNAALRFLMLGLFIRIGYQGGSICARAGESRVAATAWLISGLLACGVGAGIWRGGPALRGGQGGPLTSPLLDALPLSQSARLSVLVASSFDIHAIVLTALVSCASSTLSFGLRLALGLVFSTTTLLAGLALSRILRVTFSASALMRASWAGFGVQFVGYLVSISLAPSLGSLAPGGMRLFIPYSEVLVRGGSATPMLAGLFVLSAMSCVVISVVERIGYDRLDAVPVQRLANVERGLLTLGGIETVLASRESGRWGQRLLLLQQFGVVGLLTFFAAKNLPANSTVATVLFRGAIFIVALFASTVAMGRATRMAERDAGARALLAPLPIEPRELLRGRSRSLRKSVVAATLSFLLLLVLPGALSRWEIVWRVAMTTAALLLYADAVVAIAFLTRGAGTARASASRVSFENVLLLVPLFAVLGAPNPFAAIVSLGCLALVVSEARHAGALCVRWLDDSEEVNEETTVWRALVVFATFEATQGIVGQLLSIPGTKIDPQLQMGIAYALSAGLLLLLTGQAERGSLRILPIRLASIPFGVALGLLTGGLGVLYILVLRHLDVDMPPASSETSDIGRLVMGLSVVIFAPIAEETFFRGWLQNAIDRHRSRGRRWIAPVVTAFAFAAVHPPMSFVPVLILGLATGFLFARTGAIGPGIATHIAHNVVALFVATRF